MNSRLIVSSIFKPLKIKNSLSTRLLTYIIICSTALALIISSIELVWDYKHDVDKINESIEQLQRNFVDQMAVGLWNLDEEQIQIQVEGIMNYPNVQYVLINEVLGTTELPIIEQGLFKENFDVSKKFDLIYKGEKLGTLFVAASIDNVYDRLIGKSLLILVGQIVKVMVVSICILLIIYYVLMRHINKIALYTRNIKLSDQSEELILDGRKENKLSSHSDLDELDELVYLLNKMQNRIVSELTDKEIAIKELQQERDFSATIINSATTIICYLDTNFNMVTVNPAAVILTGFSQEELQTKNWIDIFVNKEEQEEVKRKLFKDKFINDFEIKMIDQMGDVNTILWTFCGFYEEMELKYIIGFGHDITPQKLIESKIKEVNDKLEEKIAIRTAALTNSNEQIVQTLEQLKRTQDELVESAKMASLGGLVAGVAHEINTPLGISVTALSFLEEQIETLNSKLSDNSLSRSYVEKLIFRMSESGKLLSSNLQRASDLISNFKQVAVDQSSEACYSFKLRHNLDQVISSLKHKIKQSNSTVFIECPDDLEIFSYPGAFVQIYSNLILNSIIHGFDEWEGKREIYIKIYLTDQTLHIDYRNTGKKISENIVDKIFDPFVTSKRGAGGSGLGTYIIYNIVKQLLKGDIQSIPNESGAMFTIQIPYHSTANGQNNE